MRKPAHSQYSRMTPWPILATYLLMLVSAVSACAMAVLVRPEHPVTWGLVAGLCAFAALGEALEIQLPSGVYLTFQDSALLLAVLTQPWQASATVAAFAGVWTMLRIGSSWWTGVMAGAMTAWSSYAALATAVLTTRLVEAAGGSATLALVASLPLATLAMTCSPLLLAAWARLFAPKETVAVIAPVSLSDSLGACRATLIEHGPIVLLAAVAVQVHPLFLVPAAIPFVAGWYMAEQRVVLDHTRRQAKSDPLTGLLNRWGLFDEVDSWSGTNAPTVVLLADLDDFKRLNDTSGHAAGDDALRTVSEILRGIDGRHVANSRFGGEEFVVALGGIDLERGREIALELRARIGTALGPIGSSASIGISDVEVPQSAGMSQDTCLHDAIERADRAMYSAKSSGKDRVHELLHGEPAAHPLLARVDDLAA